MKPIDDFALIMLSNLSYAKITRNILSSSIKICFKVTIEHYKRILKYIKRLNDEGNERDTNPFFP